MFCNTYISITNKMESLTPIIDNTVFKRNLVLINYFRLINKQMVWVVLELFLVMGLTWGSEVLNITVDWIQGTTHYLGKTSSTLHIESCIYSVTPATLLY